MTSELILRTNKNSIVNYFQKNDKSIQDKIDFLEQDFTKMTVGTQKIGSEWKYVSYNNTSLNTTMTNRILRTEGYISGFVLELSLPSAGGGLSWSPYPAIACIKQIKITIGKQVMLYDNISLFQYLMTVNWGRSKDDLLLSMMGSTGVATATSNIFLPLLCPGQHGCMGYHNTPFPIGKTGFDLEIEIQFRAASEFETSGASVVSAFSVAPKIHYKRYVGENGDGYISNFEGGVQPVQSYKFIDLAYDSRAYSLTSGVQSTIDINRINKNADLLWMNILLSLNTNVDQFLGVQTSGIELNVLGNKIYEHLSANEGNIKHLKLLGESQVFYTGKYYYCIPLCPDVKDSVLNIGSNGCNFYMQNPVLYVKGPSTATYYVSVSCALNSVMQIQRDGRINIIQAWDATLPPPTIHTQPNKGQNLNPMIKL